MEQTLGAIYLGDNRCHFRVWAPDRPGMEVQLVSQGDRRVPMTRGLHGYHEATLDGIPPGTRYLYRPVNGHPRPDPASRLQPEGVHKPSEVVDLTAPVRDVGWTGLPFADYVIYELHVGTFTLEGTFDAIIPRLGELKELGITAIELMPIAQFPGGRNWGYDGVNLFAAQSTYGGPHGLRRLVEACHREGLAIILDVVYNHVGPEGNYLGEFAPYFTRRYQNEWGESLNFDGPGSDEVRRFFLENALYWLGTHHIDALRLDATSAIHDHTASHFLEELGETVHTEAARHGRRWHLIAESLINDPRVIRPRDQHGFGHDAQWCDDFHHALHARLTGERNGYYADFGSLEALARAYRDGYHFQGQFNAYRQRQFGRAPGQARGEQFVIYAQNHDQVGNRPRGDRLSQILPFESLPLVAASVLLSANVPLLFMGEEYGEPAPFPFFVSHSDHRVIEGVRRGRKHEFAAFHWQGDSPDPQDEATFRRARLNWELRHEGRHGVLREFYRELLRLRKSHPALAHLDREHLEATAREDEDLIVMRRWHGEEQVLVVLHFCAKPREVCVELPAGRWAKILDSAEARWRGAGSVWPAEVGGAVSVRLAAWQVVVLQEQRSVP